MAAQAELLLPGPGNPVTRPFQSDYRSTIIAGWTIILVSFGGLGAWSALAPLSTAVIANGTVTVDSSRKTVQHLDGGTIKDILVRDGSKVEQGEILLTLDDTQVKASLKLVQGRYDAARAEEARLITERNGGDSVAFPADLVERATTDREVAEILNGQKGIFESRHGALVGQTSILRNRIEQSKAQIAGLEVQYAAKTRQIELVKKELIGLNSLHEKGYAAGNQIIAFEREAARLEGERGEVMSSIAVVRQTISEANLQIVQLQKSFREGYEKDLRETQTQEFDLAERVRASRQQLERMVIRAPASGTVVDTAVHTIGGVITPGSRILDIVPENDQLVVDAQVRPADIDGIHVGLPADIRFTAFDRRTTPVIAGKVTMVSADRLVSPKSDVPYYLVRLLVSDQDRGTLNGMKLVPGMPAEVMINKGERTVLEYLLAPLSDTLVRALRG